jgi:hypothetical protein
MLDLMFAYLFAVLLILAQHKMARRNQKQGWTRRRLQEVPTVEQSPVKQSPVKIEPAERDRPFRHLEELAALNRALLEYHIPQRPEVSVPPPRAEEPAEREQDGEMQKVEVRRKSPQREARGESSRF